MDHVLIFGPFPWKIRGVLEPKQEIIHLVDDARIIFTLFRLKLTQLSIARVIRLRSVFPPLFPCTAIELEISTTSCFIL